VNRLRRSGRLSSTDAPTSAPAPAVARGAARSADADESIDADEHREDQDSGKIAASFVDELLGRDLDQRVER
jgi:hypothetical protein